MTDKIPNDAALRSRVADLLHLLQFARIETPTAGDAEQAEKAMNDLERMLAAPPAAQQLSPAAPVAQEPVSCCPYCGGSSGRCDPSFPHPRNARQPDPVAVPRELYTCIGKGGTYELIGRSQGAGELKHQQLVVYRSDETGRLYHRTPGDFDLRMAPMAGGEE